MKLALILGNQLHRNHPALSDSSIDAIVMIEAQNICKKLPYHKHKLIFMLSAMRNFATFAQSGGKKVIYTYLEETPNFFSELSHIVQKHQAVTLTYMQPADPKTQNALQSFCESQKLIRLIYPSQLFITPEHEIHSWLQKQTNSNMEQFYRWQRKRLNLLMDGEKPIGGQWNYDHENRRALPKNYEPIPRLPKTTLNESTQSVIKIVDALFPNNPGSGKNFWLPTTFNQSDAWLKDFILHRLSYFGLYEDAMKADEPFLYHSVLSPLINCGLLSPEDCVQAALSAYKSGNAALNAVEGFVRQIIGWREYMYIMYLKMHDYNNMNSFGLTKQLELWWYVTNSPQHSALPLPVRHALKCAHGYGYNHHIERLMVLGNWFLLNNYNPLSVYKWFSAMYVDAYEWVMVPNVIGMSQYADGGKIATKPYISGGNYLKKMGRWGDVDTTRDLQQFTDLYWIFLESHYEKLKSNPRMSLVMKRIKR